MTAFNSHYRFCQPFRQGVLLVGWNTDYRPWEETEFVRDLIRPMGIMYTLGRATYNYSISLNRGRTSRDFGDREIAVFQVNARISTISTGIFLSSAS